MKPKAFNFYLDYIENIEDLSNEQIGILTRALLIYANTGEVIEMELAVKQTFKPIKKQMDIDFEKYEAKVKQCREAGANGGNKKSENAKKDVANAKNNVANVANAKNDVAKCSERSEEEYKYEEEKESIISFERIFNEFWSAYPKKRNKPDAARAFKKLKVDGSLLSAMLDALKKHKKLRQWQDKQYIPNPATWLNGHMWEDEITQADITPPNKYVGNYIQRSDDYDENCIFDFIDNMEGLEYIDEMEKE